MALTSRVLLLAFALYLCIGAQLNTAFPPATPAGSTSNPDAGFEVLIPKATGLASYTTIGTYNNHPTCARPQVIGEPTSENSISGIGASWTGTPGGHWTITYTTGTPPIMDVWVDVTCYINQ